MPGNLVIPIQEMNSFDLPSTCLVTGEEAQVTFRPVRFSWYPSWVSLLVFVPYMGLLVALIVALVLQKRARGELPFTDRGWRSWRVARVVWGIVLVVSIFCLGAGIMALIAWSTAQEPTSRMLALVLLPPGIALPFGAYYGYVRQRRILATKITDHELHLRIPRVEVAMALRAHLHVPAAEPVLQATKVAI